jgi:TRAP-type C4-dicarboxylate transport system substrate-binding protein
MSMFKRFRNQGGCAWLFPIMAAMACVAAEAAPMTVTLGTLAPDGTSYHRMLLEMREKWRKAPGGGVNLRIYAGGKMGGEAKMVSQMRLGALDAALLTAAGLSEIELGVSGLQNVPMMFHSLDELDYVSEKLRPMLTKRLEKAGFVVLFWGDTGWVRFFSKQPMLTPDDLKKTKMFVWTGNPAFTEMLKEGGLQPVPLETADIVPMLDTGLITSVSLPPFVALAGQVYSRAPHMLELNWAPLTGALVVRKPVWDKIPAEAKEALLAAATEAGKSNKAQGRAESDKAVLAMKEKGLTVHPVTPEMDAEWRRVSESFYPKIRGKLVPEDVFSEVERLVKEYRATHAPAKP